MIKRVSAIEYDGTWAIREQAAFRYVEDAQAWCEARAGTLEWGDTQIGLEGNTPETIAALNRDRIHPPEARIFQIQGIDHEDINTCRELEESDYKGDL